MLHDSDNQTWTKQTDPRLVHVASRVNAIQRSSRASASVRAFHHLVLERSTVLLSNTFDKTGSRSEYSLVPSPVLTDRLEEGFRLNVFLPPARPTPLDLSSIFRKFTHRHQYPKAWTLPTSRAEKFVTRRGTGAGKGSSCSSCGSSSNAASAVASFSTQPRRSGRRRTGGDEQNDSGRACWTRGAAWRTRGSRRRQPKRPGFRQRFAEKRLAFQSMDASRAGRAPTAKSFLTVSRMAILLCTAGLHVSRSGSVIESQGTSSCSVESPLRCWYLDLMLYL